MTYTLLYHPDFGDDLDRIGNVKVIRMIQEKIERWLMTDPEKVGKPLSGNLAGCKELKISKYRVVYSVHREKVIVYVLTAGKREHMTVFRDAAMRLYWPYET